MLIPIGQFNRSLLHGEGVQLRGASGLQPTPLHQCGGAALPIILPGELAGRGEKDAVLAVRDGLALRETREKSFVKAREVLDVDVAGDSAASVGVEPAEFDAAAPPEPRRERRWDLHGDTVKGAGAGAPYGWRRDDGRADPGLETGRHDAQGVRSLRVRMYGLTPLFIRMYVF